MKLGRKISGGKYKKGRKKKLHEKAGLKKSVKVGEEKKKVRRVRGGNLKAISLGAKFVNLGNSNNKGNKKVEIKTVLETPSNRFLARQNVLTKGTVIETSDGKVRITNRPTQEGMINGILLKE